jgi:oxygen-dependent protoporphyrinogen oxidase
MSKVIVVGGGISGLTLAYEIKIKTDMEVSVLEAKERVGGQVISERVGDFLCEAGAEGFVYHESKPWTLELCEKLGIAEQFIKPNQEIAKRYYYCGGKLRLVPTSIKSFLTTDYFSLSGRLRMALEIFTRKAPEGVDETLAEFGKRHLGEEAVKKLIGPMATGVFAGDPYKLSAKSAFPHMVELEKRGDGSIVRAMLRAMRQKSKVAPAPMGVLTSFREGIGYLISSLENELRGSIRLGKKVAKVAKVKNRYEIVTDGNGMMEADAVIIATPAYATADMLEELDPVMAEKIGQIPYPPMALVCLGYPKNEISHPLDGFGFLVMPGEGKNILGCTWDSSMFEGRAPEGQVLMRVFTGGTNHPEIAQLEDEKLMAVVKGDLKDILAVEGEPTFTKIYRYDKAIPQYMVGHADIIALIDERLKEHKGLFLTGNAYRGVGINDCVYNAMLTAEKVTEYLS